MCNKETLLTVYEEKCNTQTIKAVIDYVMMTTCVWSQLQLNSNQGTTNSNARR